MNNDLASYRKHILATRIFRGTICVILCFISLFPFYILIMNSTHSSDDILKGIQLLPGGDLVKNFNNMLSKFSPDAGFQLSLGKAMLNSLCIVIPSTLLQIYFATLTAYGVTVYDFKFKKAAWAFIYAIMMIPTQVSIVGFMQFMQGIGLYNTYWPLIIPAMAAPTTVYFMKQYMASGLSLEIVEAARIDGATEFRTFNSVVLPLMKPAMATQAIFGFVGSWNNLYGPSMLLSTPSKGNMPMFVEMIKSNDKQRDWGVIYIALLVTVLPIMTAYFILSKYIVAGVSLGGVKE